MAKSKNRKNHKKKAAARKQKLQDDKKRAEKYKREFIMDLIKKEQEKGAFSDNPTIYPVNPSINGIEGPSI